MPRRRRIHARFYTRIAARSAISWAACDTTPGTILTRIMRRRVQQLRGGGLGGVVGRGKVLLLELEYSDALLTVRLGFCSTFGIDGFFGEEIGAATRDDERGPTVAVSHC
jgi:hypothetical protein